MSCKRLSSIISRSPAADFSAFTTVRRLRVTLLDNILNLIYFQSWCRGLLQEVRTAAAAAEDFRSLRRRSRGDMSPHRNAIR